MNIYLELTQQFNSGRLRAIISSGQAVVLHHLAMMSKDGDWIIKEDNEAVRHILATLERYGTRYRFGAPLDPRWMGGGWSSHFEFMHERLRVRTDFVSRPPRLGPSDCALLWREMENSQLPFVDIRRLSMLKMTNREKDYAIIGELARAMSDPTDRLLFSRSARDLIELYGRFPDLAASLVAGRPVLLTAIIVFFMHDFKLHIYINP
jgi:hypothetical protein